MFSVIIPTLWKSEYIHTSISQLEEHPEVGEIILIDNSTEVKELNNAKICHIREGINTYVNPAWNKGVRLAKYENLCILNDDLVFDTKILDWIKPHMDLGIIGMNVANYDKWRTEFNPVIEKMEGRDWGWGCLFFVKKDKWVNIPDDLLIACGDDWLLKHIDGYKISGLPLQYQQVSITSILPEFFGLQLTDIQNFQKYK